MVVGDFDFVGLAICPAEAKPVLVVDADAMLALAVSFKCLQPVPRRDPKVVERGGGLELGEFTEGDLMERRRQLGGSLAEPELLRGAASEGRDHRMEELCTLGVHSVKVAMHDGRA